MRALCLPFAVTSILMLALAWGSGEAPRRVPPFDVKIKGKSMEPVLHAGDVRHVVAAPFDEKLEGHVLVTEHLHPGEYVSHRAVKAKHAGNGSLYFVMKGDANRAPDLWPVAKTDFVGVIEGL